MLDIFFNFLQVECIFFQISLQNSKIMIKYLGKLYTYSKPSKQHSSFGYQKESAVQMSTFQKPE